jgi:hypothetical protein
MFFPWFRSRGMESKIPADKPMAVSAATDIATKRIRPAIIVEKAPAARIRPIMPIKANDW